jgi:biopolymer transport protein ExbD
VDVPRDDDVGLNLTPMIDLVFNLVTFFLISMDLSQKDFRELDLPRASRGAEDGPDPDDRRIVASLTADGVLHLRERTVPLGAGDAASYEALVAALRAGVRDARAAGAPTPPILVRGDRAAPWRHVQTLMQACASPGVAIDRIQFAVSAPPSDAAGGR